VINRDAVLFCGLLEQGFHASIPLVSIVVARVISTEMRIGIANCKVLRELCVCAEMA
jgi:hypothetical protein